MLQGKRGLSDIVTNVLIILLVLVAVGIVWFFVQPFIRDSVSGISVDPYTVSFGIKANSVTVSGGVVNAVVERGAGAPATPVRFKVIITGPEGNKVVENNTLLKEFETVKVSYVIADLGLTSVTSVSVVPVLVTSEGKEINGQQSNPVAPTVSLSAPVCGDSLIQGSEQCEGANLNGKSCTNIPGGYTGGNLSCIAPSLVNECRFDVTSCTAGSPPVCGDGIIGAGEACDDSNNITELSCLTYGGNGLGYCNAGCTAAITFNPLTCPRCGDSILQGGNGETCDPNGPVASCSNYFGNLNYIAGSGDCSSCSLSCNTCTTDYDSSHVLDVGDVSYVNDNGIDVDGNGFPNGDDIDEVSAMISGINNTGGYDGKKYCTLASCCADTGSTCYGSGWCL